MQQTFDDVSLAELKKSFGEQFASAISALPVGTWQGPINSGYGSHIVYVAKHTDGHLPELGEVREQVRREYLDTKRREATDKFYKALLSRYSVKIELPRREEIGTGAVMRRSPILILVLIGSCPMTAFAHEVRPAYLQIHQTAAGTYDVLWKVPAVGDTMRLSLYVQLPEACSNLKEPHGVFADNAYTEQWSIQCPGGLAGSTVRIAGLTATLTDVLVRIERIDGSSQVTRVTSSSPTFVVEAMPRRFEVARTYLALGIEHILTGVDHLLFVSGLLLLVSGLGAFFLRSVLLHSHIP